MINKDNDEISIIETDMDLIEDYGPTLFSATNLMVYFSFASTNISSMLEPVTYNAAELIDYFTIFAEYKNGKGGRE